MTILSIIIPNYNYAHFLPAAIESFLSESFGDFELLVVDDASTDNSRDVIERYIRQDKRVRALFHEKNLKACKTTTNGITASTGEYIHACSADDTRLPGFLTTPMRILLQNRDISLTCSDFALLEGETVSSSPLLQGISSPLFFPPQKISSLFAHSHFWVPGHTTCVRKKTFLRYSGYNETLHAHSDWFLFHQIALHEGVAYIPESKALLRIHGNSHYAPTKKNTKEAHINLLELLQDPHERELFRKSALLGFIFRQQSSYALRHPYLWNFYPPLIRKSLAFRLKQLQKKPFQPRNLQIDYTL
ncbi:MAG: glycosyltransferase family 2 protein [Chlamydiales bacterium]